MRSLLPGDCLQQRNKAVLILTGNLRVQDRERRLHSPEGAHGGGLRAAQPRDQPRETARRGDGKSCAPRYPSAIHGRKHRRPHQSLRRLHHRWTPGAWNFPLRLVRFGKAHFMCSYALRFKRVKGSFSQCWGFFSLYFEALLI